MNYVEFLYRALEARVGIVIKTSDPKFLQQKLYQARSKNPVPGFENLTFAPSRANPESELWIVKKAMPNGSTQK